MTNDEQAPLERSPPARRTRRAVRSQSRSDGEHPKPSAVDNEELPPSAPEVDIRRALQVRLERIAALCRSLPDDEQQGPAELATKSKQIQTFVAKGLAFLANNLATSSNASMDIAFRRKVSHDLTNVVQFVGYAVDELLEIDDEHFARYRDPLHAIQQSYQGILDDLRRWVEDGESPADGSATSGNKPKTLVEQAASVPCSANGFQAAEKPNDAIAPAPKHSEIAPTPPRGTILVVDDDPDMRAEMRSWLEQMGYVAEVAANGEAAIAAIHQRPVDMLLLDFHMQGVSGAAVLDEIKRDYSLRSMPVVMMSAEADLKAIAECIRKGADDFLPKPCNKTLLEARVASCLLKGQLRRNELELNRQIRKAKRAADKILYQVFPYTIAEELRTGGRVQPRGYDNVAVMFCDIVGFTTYCQGRSAREVVRNLDQIFSAFDDIVRKHKVEKIKTIGDCVMITAGLLRRFAHPVLSCLSCAAEMVKAAASVGPGWQVRIGIHAGPVVAGLVGRQMTFDVWGDTVNTSQRVETAAEPQTIAVSEAAWAQVFQWCRGHSLGIQQLKGKGPLEIFRFEGFHGNAPHLRRRRQNDGDSRRSL